MSKAGRDDRSSVAAILADRKMDCSAAANNNKVKVMATQLLAKFEENAPAQQTGLKRQVGHSRGSERTAHSSQGDRLLVFRVPLRRNILTTRGFAVRALVVLQSSSGPLGDSLGYLKERMATLSSCVSPYCFFFLFVAVILFL